MKLANILLVEDCDADAAFFRDFFERQRICNKVTRVCDYQNTWLHMQSVERFDLLVVDHSYSWQRRAGAGRAN